MLTEQRVRGAGGGYERRRIDRQGAGMDGRHENETCSGQGRWNRQANVRMPCTPLEDLHLAALKPAGHSQHRFQGQEHDDAEAGTKGSNGMASAQEGIPTRILQR